MFDQTKKTFLTRYLGIYATSKIKKV